VTEEYRIEVDGTLGGTKLEYVIPLKRDVRTPAKLGGTSIPTNRPVNNLVFSLSGKTEEGKISFFAIEIYDKTKAEADRSNGTLQDLINNSGASKTSRLQKRFGEDGSGNYIVRTVKEQKIWLRDFILNPSLSASWRIFGGSYDFRTLDANDNNNGTPIFLTEADIERDPENKAKGLGNISFKVGDRI